MFNSPNLPAIDNQYRTNMYMRNWQLNERTAYYDDIIDHREHPKEWMQKKFNENLHNAFDAMRNSYSKVIEKTLLQDNQPLLIEHKGERSSDT